MFYGFLVLFFDHLREKGKNQANLFSPFYFLLSFLSSFLWEEGNIKGVNLQHLTASSTPLACSVLHLCSTGLSHSAYSADEGGIHSLSTTTGSGP